MALPDGCGKFVPKGIRKKVDKIYDFQSKQKF